MNKVKLQGKVDTAINVKKTQTGKSVVNFRIAVKERGKAYDEKFTIVAWEADADFVCENVHEGDMIQVLGRLSNRSWENPRTGSREYRIEIIATSGGITLKPSSPDQAARHADTAPLPTDDVPARTEAKLTEPVAPPRPLPPSGNDAVDYDPDDELDVF